MIDPRHDRSFTDVVVGYLLMHYGEWCRLQQIFGVDRMDAKPVFNAVEAARRFGLVIEGDKKRGYRLLGFQRRLYVRVATREEQDDHADATALAPAPDHLTPTGGTNHAR